MDIGFVNQTEENFDQLELFAMNILQNAANYMQLNGEVELGVILVDNAAIQEINRDYRGKDSATDVITFALEDEASIVMLEDMPRALGDIFVSVERAREQALEYGHSFEREFGFLLVHGFLHLLGYDHQNKEDEEVMFQLQEEILSAENLKKS
ncbi:rRNA maturation RNase YbeY [Culicoidibacter larvae]|uniref:Endoribonuclease YbeY n=1 Tax=Culicoidibacter larvae TaxID=2579976 RepID=A0A5R8QAL6_9FIRM|nr:rRNA maturation RNase YbeY [Culicoidibacter larvae]